MSATINASNELPQKPIPLRIIFILNALMAILPFVFYYVITSKGIEISGLEPIWMVYTGIAYIASFAVLVYCILNRNFLGLKIVIGINFLIALPTKAYIGIVVAVISILLALFNGKVKEYFGA